MTLFSPQYHQLRGMDYYRFNLNFRDIEDLLVEKGISVGYEAIRFISMKCSFG